MDRKLINCLLPAYLLITALVLFPTTGNADQKEQDLQLNATMTRIGATIADLFPIILNEVQFSNPEYEQPIAESVDRIVSLIKTAGPHFQQRSKTSQISYDVLVKHLDDTQKAIKAGNSIYAQKLLQEVAAICTSCHTQDDKSRTLFRGKHRDSFTSDFEYAEFNFLTRNYPMAVEYYERYLKSPYSLKPERVIFSATKKLLTIYTQVYNQPGKGAEHLLKLLQSNNLPPLVEKNIIEWIKGLKELEKDNAEAVKITTFEQLESYVHKYLGPLDTAGLTVVPTKKQKVFHLWLQGLLYKYFADNPPVEKIPTLLYWLSLNDRAVNYSFYFSLADLYLKECMLKHTKDDMSKRCFDEYNEYITFSYSGSLGTEIPRDVQQELKKLRHIVYGGKPNGNQ